MGTVGEFLETGGAGANPSWDAADRSGTIIVAASNTLDVTRAKSTYRCSGAADQVEIIAALTAAAAVGGEVVLLEGLYVTAATILPPAGSLALRGLGRATLIQPAGGAGNAISVTGRDDIILRDFAIDTKTSGSGGHGIFIEDGSDRFRIENVWIIDSDADGIRVEGTTITTGYIDGCQILRADEVGILVDMDAANFMYRLRIKDCDVGNCGAQGIYLHPSGGNFFCQIINNVVYDCTSMGICILDGDHSMVRGNIIRICTSDGIHIENTDHAHVVDNTCEGNGSEGIYTGGCVGLNVSLNTCEGNTSDGISVPGCSDSTIGGNTCIGNGGNGISLGNSDDQTVTGNTCTGNGVNGIILTSNENSTLTGNRCKENVEHGIYIYNTSHSATVVGNQCIGNDSGDTGNFDGINITLSDRAVVVGNKCKNQQGWGIQLDNQSDYCKISNNYTNGNVAGSINVEDATCNNTQVEFNTVEEGVITDAGTLTRSYGNYDPSANAFVGNVGAAPW